MNSKKILWTKGKILDIEDEKEYDWILTQGDRILSMGINSDEPGDYDEVFDLEGKFLMPAFIDAHSHFSANVYSFMQADLSEARNFSDIKDIIGNFIKTNKLDKDEWITAVNYDHNNLEEKDHPRKGLLDSISKTNPIAIHHQSGHMGVFNSRALDELGIDGDSEQPEGGLIEKIDGIPTGYLEENAFIHNIMRAPMPDSKELAESILKAQERYFSYGITMAQEGMMVKELIPLYQVMLDELDLDLNLVYYSSLTDKDKLIETFPATEGSYQKNLKYGGLKLFLDGSPQGKTAWLREAYEGDTDNFGTSTLSDEDLYKGLKLAYDKQLQPLAHTNGDAAIEQFIDSLTRLKAEGFDLGPLRPVLIHAQLLAPDQIGKLKDLGIIPSFFLAHIKHWGDVHLKNLGEKRANFISPAGSALDEDLIFTLHQDSPVIAPDMIETIHIAVNRKTRSGKVLGEDENISAQEAILALSKNAAFQYFEEDSRGRLKESYKADFVILSDNPLKVDDKKIEDIEVLKTIKDGKLVWKI